MEQQTWSVEDRMVKPIPSGTTRAAAAVTGPGKPNNMLTVRMLSKITQLAPGLLFVQRLGQLLRTCRLIWTYSHMTPWFHWQLWYQAPCRREPTSRWCEGLQAKCEILQGCSKQNNFRVIVAGKGAESIKSIQLVSKLDTIMQWINAQSLHFALWIFLTFISSTHIVMYRHLLWIVLRVTQPSP